MVLAPPSGKFVRERLALFAVKVLLGRRARRLVHMVLANDATRPSFECPVCSYVGPFDAFNMRASVACPSCGSLERHRFQYLRVAGGGRNPLAGKDVLHFAPERLFANLAKAARRYETADFMMPGTDHKIDITHTGLPDAAYDVVICNHVLEHVSDDAAGLSELFRILRPGGNVILSVPLTAGMAVTYEDPTITSEVDRLKHFGQVDHVRRYGRDFVDRVRAAGFSVELVQSSPAEAVRYRIGFGETAFLAHKP